MPFDLQGATATFQRMVDKILNGLIEFASAYIDDVIVFSKTWSDHLQQLGVVLEKIQDAGLTRSVSSECLSVVIWGTSTGAAGSVRSLRRLRLSRMSGSRPELDRFLASLPNYATLATPSDTENQAK